MAVPVLANETEGSAVVAVGALDNDLWMTKYGNVYCDCKAEDFQNGLAEGLRHMAANEDPYLLYCTEGKDRAGFVSALLSCFAGASYDEVLADYMTTYFNYYGVEAGTEKYDAIVESNIIQSLKLAFDVEDLTKVDLKAEASAYMAAIGLTADEIAKLSVNLTNAVQLESVRIETEAVPLEMDTYTVAVGDSLWHIAVKMLGNGNRWGEFYAVNQAVIKNVSLIYPGQKVLFPVK